MTAQLQHDAIDAADVATVLVDELGVEDIPDEIHVRCHAPMSCTGIASSARTNEIRTMSTTAQFEIHPFVCVFNNRLSFITTTSGAVISGSINTVSDIENIVSFNGSIASSEGMVATMIAPV